MAEKRMFSKRITDSDAFLEMPLSSQALYFHLSMHADDDGFVSSPKKITRVINASEDDFKILLAKKFILAFENGIIVIKHWKINNYIRSDRYRRTSYLEQAKMLYLKENKSYTFNRDKGAPLIEYLLGNKYKKAELKTGKEEEPEQKPTSKYGSVKSQIENFTEDKENFTEDKELKDTLFEFIAMRKKIKKPLTEYGMHLLLRKLVKLSTDGTTQKEIVRQSIINGWQDFFELRKTTNGYKQKKEQPLPDWYEKYKEQLNEHKSKSQDKETLTDKEIKAIMEQMK